MAGDDQDEQGENSSGKNGDDNPAGQPGDGKSISQIRISSPATSGTPTTPSRIPA
jgi:hypothetical protein